MMGGEGATPTWDAGHALRVSAKFDYGSEEWVVALLHDALEDEAVTLEELRAALPWPGVTECIEVLTRGREPYMNYIGRILSWKPRAKWQAECVLRVKIADIEDNLARMDRAHESLRPRYERALAVLREGPDFEVDDCKPVRRKESSEC